MMDLNLNKVAMYVIKILRKIEIPKEILLN